MDNQFLVSIEGLNHPVIYTAQYLRISDNTILDNCNIEFLCDIVWQSNGQITLAIQGNGVNCGSISSIAQSCGTAPDSDGDGVNDFLDNCPNTQNANQLDCNNNGIGDACEPLDSDCDGIIDSLDNCPNYPNPFQTDLNNNGIGDACEDFPKIGINQTNPKSEFHISNGSIFIDNPEKGLILKNHQGQCYTLKANENILQVVYIPCPQ
ncbi:MAG: thrombospondin type 3 repeat-containing protein [Saprospiraceae bacterium]|nr:thrombospondin type 3 repeat-containing protein [Saprospiraceae bacterium]